MMAIVAANLAGGNTKGDRQAHDFYPSPTECTTSFLAHELKYLTGKKILEPCCGDGAISKVLIEAGLEVVSTDLIYRGYGQGDKDFLLTAETDCTAIVTNPPFNISEAFIWHALETLKVDYMAMILKSHYWHSKNRYKLFKAHPPAVVYPMLWRPDFLKKGAPTMDASWIVWRKHEGNTQYVPMEKVI